MPLNDLRCKNAKPKTKPYKLTDNGGLYLFITPTGNRSWRYKYRYLGKEKTLSIGGYPAITLQEARKLRDKAKEQLRNGDDPSFEKAEAKRLASYKAAQTFDLIAKEWHTKYLSEWSSEHGKRILYRLDKTILQAIGHYPIDKLTPQLLLTCLQKAESRSPELAINMLHYCSRIFQYAGLTGRLDRDLAFGLKGALKKPKRGHYACIPLEELPAFLKALYAPASKRRSIPNLAALLCVV